MTKLPNQDTISIFLFLHSGIQCIMYSFPNFENVELTVLKLVPVKVVRKQALDSHVGVTLVAMS
jgi:hypothetical protein